MKCVSFVLAFLLTAASTTSAGPILGELDVAVIAAPPPCIVAAPNVPDLNGIPTLSDHIDIGEVWFGPGGDGGLPGPGCIAEDEVYQFDDGVVRALGGARVIYD